MGAVPNHCPLVHERLVKPPICTKPAGEQARRARARRVTRIGVERVGASDRVRDRQGRTPEIVSVGEERLHGCLLRLVEAATVNGGREKVARERVRCDLGCSRTPASIEAAAETQGEFISPTHERIASRPAHIVADARSVRGDVLVLGDVTPPRRVEGLNIRRNVGRRVVAFVVRASTRNPEAGVQGHGVVRRASVVEVEVERCEHAGLRRLVLLRRVVYGHVDARRARGCDGVCAERAGPDPLCCGSSVAGRELRMETHILGVVHLYQRRSEEREAQGERKVRLGLRGGVGG